MYLKEIKASGFKSFADTIDIELTNGISGIVGPNGSGKSNVVDAVRWVLGEQSVKQLRGEGSMSDVIFTGSKSRRAASFASVTLVFDNSDKYLNIEYDEVQIKRTIYKTGENEYFINNTKARLKDILELFMDTGASKESFNIISQGDVANILSGKAEDRRVIFEEASGVLKYKKRKDEALRKLSKTHDNMARVDDIISELNTNMEPLKKQSEDAKIYLEKKEKLENVEIALTVNDIEKYNYEYKYSKEKVSELTLLITKMLSENSNEQAKIETIKNNISKLNSELYLKQQKLVKVSANAEKLSGEKAMISERSKYNSEDVKLHDNIISLKEKILKLKKEKNALIVAHLYQRNEIQEIADIVGDSYFLSKKAMESDKDLIIFCGVKFMAESAKILSPNKKILIPSNNTTCPMADMALVDRLQELKDKHPNAKVVSYINSNLDIKALSDVCVTSSSAINILNNLDTDEVIFLPDRNLGSYLSEQIPNKNFTLYPGFCPTHERIEKDEILELKEKYPNYPVLVHPECNKSVRNLADYIGSTSELINYSASSNANGFIVVTEEGVFYEMKLKSPNKTFIPTKTGMICPNMKKISLNDLYNCLKNEEFEVNIDEELRFKAHKALENMHLLSV